EHASIGLRGKRCRSRQAPAFTVAPPSTRKIAAVMKDASGEARNTAADAIFSGVPRCPSGVFWRRDSYRASSLLFIARAPGVGTVPGQTAFTRILRGPNSTANERVKDDTPPLIAE